MKVLIISDLQNNYLEGIDIHPFIDKIKKFEGVVLATYIPTEDIEENNLDKSILYQKNYPNRKCNYDYPEEMRQVLLEKEYFSPIAKEDIGSLKIPSTLINYIYITNEPITSIEICGLHLDTAILSIALILKTKFNNIPIIINRQSCICSSCQDSEVVFNILKNCGIKVINSD